MARGKFFGIIKAYMVIQYYGGGSFRVSSGEKSILIDPENNRLKADVILRTISPPNIDSESSAEIAFPGEYEIGGVEILGVGVPAESTEKFIKTVYYVTFEDIRLAFFGHISKMPEVKILEEMGEPDVVIIPTGADHFLPEQDAVTLIKKIEPAMVIPSFFKDLKNFKKALGQKSAPEEKAVFKKKDLETGKIRLVTLAPKSS